MHWACYRGHLPVAEHLTKAGADIGARDEEVSRVFMWRWLMCVVVAVCRITRPCTWPAIRVASPWLSTSPRPGPTSEPGTTR